MSATTTNADATPPRTDADGAAAHSDGRDARATRTIVELRAANDTLMRSITRLAHDFNNVLTVLMGHLSALEPQVDADLVERHVDPAMRACRRGADIARSLTDLAQRPAVEPGDVGDGARVCLLTPAAAGNGRDGAHPPERRELVLIVGGDDHVRAARRAELVADDFGVIEARDASEAQALLVAVEEIRAVVLDVSSPGDATGSDVADRAREARPDVAIVLIARAAEPQPLADSAVVLTAPVTPADLARAIARGRAAQATLP